MIYSGEKISLLNNFWQRIKFLSFGKHLNGGIFIMQDLTAKELELISDVLTYEGLICKKARAYSKTLTDVDLANCVKKLADEHEQRYNALLGVIGG